MVEGRRVVVVVPAGRKRFLSILVPYLEALRGVVDECRFWINTNDPADVAYIEGLAKENPAYYTITRLADPKPEWSGNIRVRLIREFYPTCCEAGVVYIRFDDDVCWVEVSAVEAMVRYRVSHPEWLLVYPAIINNGRTMYIHQAMGLLPVTLDGSWTGHKFDSYNLIKHPATFGEAAHQCFLERLATDEVDSMKFGVYVAGERERVPINCILWLGETFAEFGGVVADESCDMQEEIWLTEVAPQRFGKRNVIYGDCLVCHFAFNTQREYLEERTNLLDYYAEIAANDGAWPFKGG